MIIELEKFKKMVGGAEAQFTIYEVDKSYFIAKVIAVDNITDENQNGMKVSDGNGNTVKYKDNLRLKADIVGKYGDDDFWLKSEL